MKQNRTHNADAGMHARIPYLIMLWMAAVVAWAPATALRAQTEGLQRHSPATLSTMPIGNVHSIYRDHEGYMWYSTEDNLCRDNGYQVDVFSSDSRNPFLMNSNFVLDIVEDGNHHIWFSTRGSTYILDKHNYTIHEVLDAGKPVHTETLYALTDGTVWLSTGYELIHFDSHEHVVERLQCPRMGNGGKYANSFFEDSQHTLWLCESGGKVCRFDTQTHRFVPLDWDTAYDPQDIVEDPCHGCYWVSTWDKGIVRYVPSALGSHAQMVMQPSTWSLREPNNKGLIIDIKFDKQRHLLWVTAMDGLHAYLTDKASNLVETNIEGLLPEGKNIVDQMEFDNMGNLWVAGLSPHTFFLTSPIKGLRRDPMRQVQQAVGTGVICDFVVSDGDVLWIWDARLGLELHNPLTGTTALGMHQAENASLPGSRTITPIRHGQGMWMVSGDRMVRLWHEGMTIRRQEVARLPDNPIHSLYDVGDGSVLVGGAHGVHRVWIESGRPALQLTDSTSTVFRVAMDKWGTLFYHDKSMGLCLKAKGAKSHKNLLPEHELCTSMTLLKDGTLWFGSHLGRVYRLLPQQDTPEYIEALSNPLGNRILDIQQDTKGDIWVVTCQTVKEWNPRTGHTRTVMSNDPYISIDYFRTLAVYGDSICVTGSDGYCMMAPSKDLEHEHSDVKPSISTIIVDDVQHFVGVETHEMDIPCDTRLLEIRLTTLNQVFAPQTQFAYRFVKKGLFASRNEDWTILPRGVNSVIITSPLKGDYTLQVKATDPYEIWGTPVDLFVIHRLPAWWETWWAYTIYLLCALAIVWFAVRQYNQRQKRRRIQQMEERVTELKFQFFTNISHELRTPLSLIMVPLDSMLKNSRSLCEKDRARLEGIQHNAQDLLQLINQLLDFRRMELGNMQLHVRNGNLKEFLQAAQQTFQPLAQRKRITLTMEGVDRAIYANFDHEKMHHILWNLLSNAFKFTPEGGRVSIKLQSTPEHIRLSVSDTGCGIAPNEQVHLFDRFYQAQQGAEQGGSGIGLHMVSELVKLHGGEVGVESQPGKGSTFWFTFPHAIPTQDHSAPTPKMKGEGGDPSELTDKGESTGEKSHQRILLVEDNIEFRTLMAEELTEMGYEVLQAGDGEKALEVMQQVGGTQGTGEIDLVISDVMMPNMDGLELCRHLKSHLDTSHIPLILLTAKSSEESQLEGYKMGADYYITKPFSMDILSTRIHHLMHQRSEERERFQHTDESDVVAITHSPLDEEFLARAIDVFKQHISIPDYSVEQYASDMCTSRMTLYRKLQHITGQSPTDFMTNLRIKEAAHLLTTTTLTIATVGEHVGFSNASYFTKIFKNQFGMRPKDYRNQSTTLT